MRFKEYKVVHSKLQQHPATIEAKTIVMENLRGLVWGSGRGRFEEQDCLTMLVK